MKYLIIITSEIFDLKSNLCESNIKLLKKDIDLLKQEIKEVINNHFYSFKSLSSKKNN